jgi:hypothetical protein
MMRPTAYIGLKEAPKIKTSQWCVEVSTRRVGVRRVPGQVKAACILVRYCCIQRFEGVLSGARMRKTRVRGGDWRVGGEDGERSFA